MLLNIHLLDNHTRYFYDQPYFVDNTFKLLNGSMTSSAVNNELTKLLTLSSILLPISLILIFLNGPIVRGGRMHLYTPLVLALRRLRQEDSLELRPA